MNAVMPSHACRGTAVARPALFKTTFVTTAMKVIEVDRHRVISSTARSVAATPPRGAATAVVVPKASTNDFRVIVIECVVADCTPLTVVVHFHPAFVLIAPSGESDISSGRGATNRDVFMVTAVVSADSAGHCTSVT